CRLDCLASLSMSLLPGATTCQHAYPDRLHRHHGNWCRCNRVAARRHAGRFLRLRSGADEGRPEVRRQRDDHDRRNEPGERRMDGGWFTDITRPPPRRVALFRQRRAIRWQSSSRRKFVLADGSVRFIEKSIDSRVWEAMATLGGKG